MVGLLGPGAAWAQSGWAGHGWQLRVGAGRRVRSTCAHGLAHGLEMCKGAPSLLPVMILSSYPTTPKVAQWHPLSF